MKNFQKIFCSTTKNGDVFRFLKASETAKPGNCKKRYKLYNKGKLHAVCLTKIFSTVYYTA